MISTIDVIYIVITLSQFTLLANVCTGELSYDTIKIHWTAHGPIPGSLAYNRKGDGGWVSEQVLNNNNCKRTQ